MGKAEILLRLANGIAAGAPGFYDVKGPGGGNRSTNEFIAALRSAAESEFGEYFSERAICGSNRLAVDYYFPDESTIVEVALGLRNPNTEFEKDILKALIAKGKGNRVERLFLISKPGGRKKCQQPGRSEFIAWLKEQHNIDVEVYDLRVGHAFHMHQPDARASSATLGIIARGLCANH